MNQLSRQYGTYEKQAELLAMIKDIDQLFAENDIQYSLCGGTLLGAVRENGFIPWDDDIDIMVERANYNKITSLFEKIGGGYRYILKRHLWIDRIQRSDDSRKGIYATSIDIFIMDHCPDSHILRQIKILLIKILQGMMKQEQIYENHSLVYKACLWLTHLLGKPFSDERKFRWYQSVSQIGNNKETEYLTGYNDLFKLLKLRYTGHLFDKIVRHEFEDLILPITAEYDSYLRTQYGDYMTPPKESDRIPIHTL